MKILYLYKDYFPVLGGIENYMRQLAEGMLERGHEVEVLVTSTSRQTQQEERGGVKIIKTSRWVNLASAPLSPSLVSEYLKRKPDVVHLQFPYPPGEIAWLIGSYQYKIPTVLTYHSDIVRQKRLLLLYKPFLKQILKRVDKILPTSPNYIESSDFLRPLRAKCEVVPLGIDHARFTDVMPLEIGQADSPILLFTGRLRYYKGLQYLVEALPKIKSDARLVIVGIGPMETQLRTQIARLGLTNRVIFAGEVSDEDLPGYYAACDIFVLPACERSEAFSIVQMEALASGKPSVSTELGTGTSYVNQNGQTGLVVPPADPLALAGAVNRLLDDKALRLKMGRQGQMRIRKEFGLTKMLDHVEQIYTDLVKK